MSTERTRLSELSCNMFEGDKSIDPASRSLLHICHAADRLCHCIVGCFVRRLVVMFLLCFHSCLTGSIKRWTAVASDVLG